MNMRSLPADAVPLNGADLETLRRIWEREAVLGGCALLVEADGLDVGDGGRQASVNRFVERAAVLLRPNGRLLLTMPNRRRVFAVLKRALGKPHSSTDYPPHHLTRWSAVALRRLLELSFGEVRVGSLPYYFAHRTGRALAVPLHVLTVQRMGQSLCAIAQNPLAA